MENYNPEIKCTVRDSNGVLENFNFKVQYFKPNETYNLHEHSIKNGKHVYKVIGTKNCRDSFYEVNFGNNGYFKSLYNILLQKYKGTKIYLEVNFSGFCNSSGEYFHFSYEIDNSPDKNLQVVDDFDKLLLMNLAIGQKSNEP